jgi:NAD(P)-dependent dehydrogenase (short-subunit alcohol dehydrogenase family)
MKIKDHVSIVTGGASGLGEATVRAIVEAGGKAAIFDLADQRGAELAKELGDAAIYCHVDVADEKSAADGVAKTVEAFGAVHSVVNCAGIGIPAKVVGKKSPMPHL